MKLHTAEAKKYGLQVPEIINNQDYHSYSKTLTHTKSMAIHHFKKQNRNDFLAMISKAQGTKENIGKLGVIKIKNFCASKSKKGTHRMVENICKLHVIRD